MSIKYSIPWWKRPFDLIFSLIIIFLTFPIMLLIALAIKLTDKGVVGPRPYIPGKFEEYKIPESIQKKLLSVKPGITELWQVEARNEAIFFDRIKYDLKYIENQFFFLDLKIIFKTIWVMLTGKGAY